jgi:hypothetical protein
VLHGCILHPRPRRCSPLLRHSLHIGPERIPLDQIRTGTRSGHQVDPRLSRFPVIEDCLGLRCLQVLLGLGHFPWMLHQRLRLLHGLRILTVHSWGNWD